jgi:hypothetical protein
METLAIFLSFLSQKTPEFIAGASVGLIVALFIAYVYFLPRLIKASTAALTVQISLLSNQVKLQTDHIGTLERQLKALEEELIPYRDFAKEQLAKVLAVKTI